MLAGWAKLSQAARDAAYNNNLAVANSAALVERRNAASVAFRAAHPTGLDVPYGAAVRQRFDLPEGVRIAVGIERFDYTKGILDRIRAIDDLLTRHPEWKGTLVFIQAAAPTRSKLPAYAVPGDGRYRVYSA